MSDPHKGITDSDTAKTTYFVMKCINIESLQKCIRSNTWAYREREKPPQPHELLSSAQIQGRVILIFSVSGQHGWHGYCEYSLTTNSCSKAFLTESKKDSLVDEPVQNVSQEKTSTHLEMERPWHHFPVRWLLHFQELHPHSCLDFKSTESLTLSDGTLVNKARNWQELPHGVGKRLCQLLEEHHFQVMEREKSKQIAKQPESFLKNEKSVNVLHVKETWKAVIDKVSKELGEVHLACPFGSHRYNLHEEDSDLDIFIVYQAKTIDILGLDLPKQTIKNSHHEDVDYSVLELQCYCQLLVQGDAKCVETLFLANTPAVVVATPLWHKLCNHRHLLLNIQCLDKYMKEIQGTTGLKQFHRWRESNPYTEILTQKLKKLAYIVLRLLQNARDMAKGNELVVFREAASKEYEELKTARKGDLLYSPFIGLVESYLSEVNNNKKDLQHDLETAKSKVQDWLLECRLQDLQMNVESKDDVKC